MYRSRTFRRTTLSLGLAAALATTVATPAYARPGHGQPTTAPTTAAAPTTGQVFSITDRIAREVAGTLANPSARHRIVPAVTRAPLDLATAEPGTSLAAAVQIANREVLTAKGLPSTGSSLLQLRLADPQMRAALDRGATPLVTAVPNDDTSTSVTAYEPTGRAVQLDPVRLPARPVLVVEVDTATALPMGLDLLRDTLTANGIGSAAASAATTSATASATSAGTTATGYWATKVTAIQVADVKEPWIKGNAEIFNLVGGFGLDGKVKVDAVQMPYLDKANQTYYPNQLLVHFNGYKYNLADVVMMEDDGDTNYQALVKALVTALLTIIDGGVYIPLANAILDALPTSWYTDDPDYVDSWYTLSKTSSGRINGAAGNGWMTVAPYFVEAL
ncbi:DUF3103 family protein [Micromonospora polyrhachis]|uniref:DUF3103 family protein n=1 Tax=Micromonospora polyrhachis TaxID=1282883 RepID=A0A7W7WNG9_9ACTN|nr:DUF3103 family protein [Micromonospora polyrhachis]MBB4957845.1 hypothetical protein [Micromonospora polyrhachis]